MELHHKLEDIMDKKQAIKLLKEKSKEAIDIARLPYNSDPHITWRRNIEDILESAFTVDSTEYKRVKNLGWHAKGTRSELQRAYVRFIHRMQQEVESIIQKYERLKLDTTDKEKAIPKAFIAHEGETEHLKKLKEFLEALGVNYYIAETEASNGRSIEGQVDWTQSKADFAICLATKGKAVNKKTGKYYMGLNVADELGRARQIFKNKIILLVQKGVEIHANTSEIVHASFTTQSMDSAFIKVVKELRNWGFIKV
jgi:CAP12/Pycsar effector protein, TIR domain